MFSYIKSLIKTYKKIKFYDKFTTLGIELYIKEWKNFYINNIDKIDVMINDLKKDLDIESIALIDKIIENVIYKIPNYTNNFLVKKSFIYSQHELKNLEKYKIKQKEKLKIYKQYKLDGNEKLDFAVFGLHCGLKFLDENILKNFKNKIAIDCGGYFGDSALIFNKYKFKEIKVFEPNSYNFKKLINTVKNNNLSNVECFNYAAYSDNCKKEMYYLSNNLNQGASLKFSSKKSKYEIVNCIKIDNYNFTNVGLIKIDAEGEEIHAIDGMIETIKKNKPLLLVSVYHSMEEFLKIKIILANLNIGYKFKLRSLNLVDILNEVVLLCYL